jgi:hypothetical protein
MSAALQVTHGTQIICSDASADGRLTNRSADHIGGSARGYQDLCEKLT